ncbi:MAG: adenosylcobinamide-GDP ribazoletransferase [Acidimicrobiales bacterium]
MRGLLGAVTFLTRLPVRGATARADGGPSDLAATVAWFPFVGALIGVTTAATYAVGLTVLSPLPAATLAVGGQVLLTGALHEDGLADLADAAGGPSTEDRLAILGDPRQGTFGVLALVLAVLARVAAVAGLGAVQALCALAAAHTLGRAAAVVLMGAVASVPGHEGLASGHRRALTPAHVVVASGSAVGLAALAVGVWVLPAAAVVAVVAVIVGRWARRNLGGVTGDVLGAVTVLCEVAVLVLAAAAAAGDGPTLTWWR